MVSFLLLDFGQSGFMMWCNYCLKTVPVKDNYIIMYFDWTISYFLVNLHLKIGQLLSHLALIPSRLVASRVNCLLKQMICNKIMSARVCKWFEQLASSYLFMYFGKANNLSKPTKLSFGQDLFSILSLADQSGFFMPESNQNLTTKRLLRFT